MKPEKSLSQRFYPDFDYKGKIISTSFNTLVLLGTNVLIFK